MESIRGYTSKDFYSKDKVHDIVGQLCNCILYQKGLNPNNCTVIASLVPSDNEFDVEYLAIRTDEV
eukprot:13559277-Ditylum_brightwellii.AAC.1